MQTTRPVHPSLLCTIFSLMTASNTHFVVLEGDAEHKAKISLIIASHMQLVVLKGDAEHKANISLMLPQTITSLSSKVIQNTRPIPSSALCALALAAAAGKLRPDRRLLLICQTAWGWGIPLNVNFPMWRSSMCVMVWRHSSCRAQAAVGEMAAGGPDIGLAPSSCKAKAALHTCLQESVMVCHAPYCAEWTKGRLAESCFGQLTRSSVELSLLMLHSEGRAHELTSIPQFCLVMHGRAEEMNDDQHLPQTC